MTAVHYMVCEDSSLSNCGRWIESTAVLTDKKMLSQRITELLRSITDGKFIEFFKSWVNYRIEKEYIAYDITSISSYSELIEVVELGYNRDKEHLPQINLGMFFGETSKLPIFYNIFQGSIKDVRTLTNMLTYTDLLNITNIKFVMDKGFYSDANITEMLKLKKKFTIAVPFKNMKAMKAVQHVRDYIHLPGNSVGYGEELIFGVTDTIIWPVEQVDGTTKDVKVYQQKCKKVFDGNFFYRNILLRMVNHTIKMKGIDDTKNIYKLSQILTSEGQKVKPIKKSLIRNNLEKVKNENNEHKKELEVVSK